MKIKVDLRMNGYTTFFVLYLFFITIFLSSQDDTSLVHCLEKPSFPQVDYWNRVEVSANFSWYIMDELPKTNASKAIWDGCCYPYECYTNKSEIPTKCTCVYPVTCGTLEEFGIVGKW